MAEGVVDYLEAVEVQEQHSYHPIVAGCPVKGILEAV